MAVKDFFLSVVVLVIALLVFSYISNPESRSYIKSFFSNIGETSKETIENIPSLIDSSCMNNARDLIPKYLFLSEDISDQSAVENQNYWRDGNLMTRSSEWYHNCDLPLKIADFRVGSGTGENINHYYYNPTIIFNCLLVYSKKNVSKNGEVLGTTSFRIDPIIKLYEKQVQIEIDYLREEDIYIFKWFGFDQDMKKIYGNDTLRYKLLAKKNYATRLEIVTICEFESSSEEGEFVCDNFLESACSSLSSGCMAPPTTYIEITPDINRKIYEIVDPQISECNWVFSKN